MELESLPCASRLAFPGDKLLEPQGLEPTWHSVISKQIGVCRHYFSKECSWFCGQEEDETRGRGKEWQRHSNGLATGMFSLTRFCDGEMAGLLGPCWSKELVELLWRTWVSECIPWVVSKHWSLELLL